MVVLLYRDDSLAENLRSGPKLEVFVDLVELDEVGGAGGTLFKIVEALRGDSFFSTIVELNTKGAGGEGVGCKIIDSNISLLLP